MPRYRTKGSGKLYVDVFAMHKEVTGSKILVTTHFPDGDKTRFLIDCGLFQEKQYDSENGLFKFKPENVDFAVLTHNHADHNGLLPLLIKSGMSGPIYTTPATQTLLCPALYNNAQIQKEFAKRENRKSLYMEEDVRATLNKVVAYPFKNRFKPSENITVTFFANGHLPGAALVLVQVKYPGYNNVNLLFTGDYNNKNLFFHVEKLPKWVLELPLTVIQECTYGSSIKEDMKGSTFEKNILEKLASGGKVIICTMAQERTQHILYLLKNMQDSGKLDVNIPILLDGKLSRQYTNIYLNKDIGINPKIREFLPRNFDYSDKERRKKSLTEFSPEIVIVSSGMGSNGCAREYISKLLSHEEVLIQFTSYLAEGTIGRKLMEAKLDNPIEVFGRVIKEVKAKVGFTTEFSSHANADGLIDFLKPLNLNTVLINHGSLKAKEDYSKRLIKEFPNVEVGILGEYTFRVGSEGIVKTI